MSEQKLDGGAVFPESPVDTVVFLDFDDVLNNNRTFGTCPRVVLAQNDRGDKIEICGLDPVNGALLARLMDRYSEARIVFSTSWRVNFKMDELIGFVSPFGIAKERFVGRTRYRGGDEPRGHEIAAWLQEYIHRHDNVPKALILDDLWASEFQPVGRHLVQTNGRVGLDEESFGRACRLLDDEDVSRVDTRFLAMRGK